MLPQISENFNWPKPVARVGLICCLSEAEHWVLETGLGKFCIYFACYGSSTWCQAGISAQVLQPLLHFFCGLCRPEPGLWELQWTDIDSKMFCGRIPTQWCAAMLRRRMAVMIQWPNYLSSECDRQLLSLGVQRLVFNFPLPSAALGSSCNIPGTSSLLPQIPVFWDKPWGRAWSPGVLTLFLFCSQCSGI